jgi:hypothetical protein
LVGWSNPAFILSHPGFHNKVLLDAGYYLLLLFGVLPFTKHIDPKHRWLFTAILLTFTLIWATSAEQDMLGWYKIPLFTFLAIASGSFIKKEIPLFAPLLIVIASFSNIGLIRFPNHPLPSTETLRFVIAGIVGCTILLQFVRDGVKLEKIKEKLLIASFIFYACISLRTSNQFYQALCESQRCPVPEMSLKDFLHITRR